VIVELGEIPGKYRLGDADRGFPRQLLAKARSVGDFAASVMIQTEAINKSATSLHEKGVGDSQASKRPEVSQTDLQTIELGAKDLRAGLEENMKEFMTLRATILNNLEQKAKAWEKVDESQPKMINFSRGTADFDDQKDKKNDILRHTS
jgi:hypothetical protein